MEDEPGAVHGGMRCIVLFVMAACSHTDPSDRPLPTETSSASQVVDAAPIPLEPLSQPAPPDAGAAAARVATLPNCNDAFASCQAHCEGDLESCTPVCGTCAIDESREACARHESECRRSCERDEKRCQSRCEARFGGCVND